MILHIFLIKLLINNYFVYILSEEAMFKKLFSLSIRKKLVLGFSLLLVSALLVNFLINYSLMSNNITNMSNNNLENNTRSVYSILKASVESSIKSYLRGIAEKGKAIVQKYYDMYKSGLITEEEAWNRVKNIFLHPRYYKIGKTGYLAGVSGEGVLIIHPESPGVDASKHAFMQKATQMKNGYLEYMWANKGEEEKRAKAGWLSYFEPWDLLIWASSYKSEFRFLVDPHDFREQLLSIEVGEGGYPYVIDMNGDLIIHPELEEGESVLDVQDYTTGEYFIQTTIEKIKDHIDQYKSNSGDSKNIDEAEEEFIGKFRYSWKNPSEDFPRMKFANYKYIRDMEWIVLIGVYEDVLYSTLYEIRNISIIIIVVSVIAIIFLIIITTKPVKKMTNRLKDIAESLEKGDFTKEIEIKSNDELGVLSRDFNDFIQTFNKIIKQIKDSAKKTQNLSSNLASTSEQSRSSIAQMKIDIKQIMEKTKLLDNEINKSTESAYEVKDYISQVVDLITEQASAIAESSSSIEQMSASIQNVANITEEKLKIANNLEGTAEKGEKEMNETINLINKVAESANIILDMIDVINNIAGKTNLLAMNASIEAAHAGESGRGFSVVAEEIRNLAENTAQNAMEISNSLQEVIKYIKTSEESTTQTGEVFKKVMTGIKEVSYSMIEMKNTMDELATGSSDVNQSLGNLVDITEKVKFSSDNMNQRIVGISNSMQNISGISNEVKKGMDNFMNEIDELYLSIESVSNFGVMNNKNISELKDMISQFKIKENNQEDSKSKELTMKDDIDKEYTK